MRKNVCIAVAVLLLIATCFAGCGTEEGGFRGFGEPFTADVEGEWRGVAFSAEISGEAAGEGGVQPLTVTFYAPEALCGTVLRRRATGETELSVGELSLPVTADFEAFFAMFGADATKGRASVTEEGMTAIETDGVRYLLLPDDTLFRIECAKGFLNVKRFSAPV